MVEGRKKKKKMKEKEKEERPKIRNEKRFWETVDV